MRSTSARRKRAGRRSRTTVPRSDWTETTLGCCPEQRDQTGTPSISPTVWTTHTSLRELDRRRVQTGKTRLGLFEPSVSPPTKHAHLLHTKVERWSMGRCSSLNLQLPSEVNRSKKCLKFTTGTSQFQPAHNTEVKRTNENSSKTVTYVGFWNIFRFHPSCERFFSVAFFGLPGGTYHPKVFPVFYVGPTWRKNGKFFLFSM